MNLANKTVRQALLALLPDYPAQCDATAAPVVVYQHHTLTIRCRPSQQCIQALADKFKRPTGKAFKLWDNIPMDAGCAGPKRRRGNLEELGEFI